MTGAASDSGVNRRDFLRLAAGGATLLAAGVGCNSGEAPKAQPISAPTTSGAQRKTLRIAQWNHYVAGYDAWWDEEYTKGWGERNDCEVVVDHFDVNQTAAHADAELSQQRSHDLVSLNLLERAVNILDNDPSVFVAYPRTKLIDAEGKITGDFEEHLHLMDEQPSKRWIGVQKNIRLGNLHYGLNRADKFRKTGLMRNYNGGDFPLIAEMSLYGKFYEIPDAFFYRRMHEEASSAMKNSADVMAFYDPKKRANLFLYNWVHLGANLNSVRRAPISLVEKLKIVGFQARSLVWSRREYLGELAGTVTYTARKINQR